MSYRRKEIIGDCELYLGDCLEVMPILSCAYDLVTDPPYGIDEANGKNKSRGHLAKAVDYGQSDWDSKPAVAELTIARSMTVNQVIFGGNYYDLPPTSCWLIWDKRNTGDFADCEMAWTNLKKAVRLKQHLWNGMLRKGGEKRFHPTQKPLEVMQWCVEHLPKSEAPIFDPFMGSGTTGVACVKLGRKFIGIEIDEGYFDIACKRIEEAYKQPDFFVERSIKKEEQLKLAVT